MTVLRSVLLHFAFHFPNVFNMGLYNNSAALRFQSVWFL